MVEEDKKAAKETVWLKYTENGKEPVIVKMKVANVWDVHRWIIQRMFG